MRYDYNCPTCGDIEIEHPMSDPALEECPRCGDELRRLITCARPFVLRGHGWSADGYEPCGQAKNEDR